MRGSTPDTIDGIVEISVALVDAASTKAPALAELVATWIGAVEVGVFGGGELRVVQPLAVHGRAIGGSVACEQVSLHAFWTLARMTSRFSRTKGRIAEADARWKGGQRSIWPKDAAAVSAPPPSNASFPVTLPNDIHADVRVEIEFTRRLAPADRDSVFRALSLWDAIAEAMADEECWDEVSEYESRLMSPSVVEHVVYGYFAGFGGLDLAVHLGCRLHQRLPVARMLIE